MFSTTIKPDAVAQTNTAVKPVIPAPPITIDIDQNDAPYPLIQGKKYSAFVESRLPNGNFSVLISNRSIQIHLPETVQPGSTIKLILLSQQPRLKFVLQLENTIHAANNSTISVTGKLLNILTQESKTPLLLSQHLSTNTVIPQTLLNNPKIPFLLQQAIRQSGLFYESHLAKWISGSYTLKDLQQEPLGQLKFFSPATTLISDTGIDTRSLSFVQQQLVALEKHYLSWHGEIWNNQKIRWDIYEETSENNNKKNLTLTQWKTKLTLTLPELGKIVIKLSINAQDLIISIDAANNHTVQKFNMDQIKLKQSMKDKGFAIQSFSVQHYDNSE